MTINNEAVNMDNDDVRFSINDLLDMTSSLIYQMETKEDEQIVKALISTLARTYCDKVEKPIAQFCVEMCTADAFIKEVNDD